MQHQAKSSEEILADPKASRGDKTDQPAGSGGQVLAGYVVPDDQWNAIPTLRFLCAARCDEAPPTSNLTRLAMQSPQGRGHIICGDDCARA